MMNKWFKKGEHWIWLSAGSVGISVVLVFGLIGMISYKGLSHFWAHEVYSYTVMADGKKELVVGEVHDTQMRVREIDERIVDTYEYLIKTGNRDVYNLDFRWIRSQDLVYGTGNLAENLTVIERYKWGDAFGQLKSMSVGGKVIAKGYEVESKLRSQVKIANELQADIHHIEKTIIGGISYKIEDLRLDQRKLEARGQFDALTEAKLNAKRDELHQQFLVEKEAVQKLSAELNELGFVTLISASNQEMTIYVKQIVRFWQPNEMVFSEKIGFFFDSIGHFLLDDPREANTEGGVFPAIVGTVTMVMLMAILVTPMGVLAAIYMSEYAREGLVLRIVRISINNLAGVPSIVFGIFGLGFFVYIIGGSIDDLFFSYSGPSPTFGTPGLLWASLTMALLTLPVVIVSTQEGLSRVPRSLREGGLALGATKAETIMRIVLPMTTPAIMTGLILAVARAAGEVAPLMLVGVVKLAPALPVDFNAPFIHLDRQFMHLGFHIFDVGFQSPNVEASRPLVYATSLLLILIIIGLNLTAIMIRNRLREKYKALDH